MNEDKRKKISIFLSILSIVFGVIGIILCFSFCLGTLLSVLSVILCVISIVLRKKMYGLALAGLIVSVISILLNFLYLIISFLIIIYHGEDMVIDFILLDIIFKILRLIFN